MHWILCLPGVQVLIFTPQTSVLYLKILLAEIYFIITLTLDHSRLNEGHTMFVERKITKTLHNSEALRQFQAIRGLNELKEEIVICINRCDFSFVKFKEFTYLLIFRAQDFKRKKNSLCHLYLEAFILFL